MPFYKAHFNFTKFPKPQNIFTQNARVNVENNFYMPLGPETLYPKLCKFRETIYDIPAGFHFKNVIFFLSNLWIRSCRSSIENVAHKYKTRAKLCRISSLRDTNEFHDMPNKSSKCFMNRIQFNAFKKRVTASIFTNNHLFLFNDPCLHCRSFNSSSKRFFSSNYSKNQSFDEKSSRFTKQQHLIKYKSKFCSIKLNILLNCHNIGSIPVEISYSEAQPSAKTFLDFNTINRSNRLDKVVELFSICPSTLINFLFLSSKKALGLVYQGLLNYFYKFLFRLSNFLLKILQENYSLSPTQSNDQIYIQNTKVPSDCVTMSLPLTSSLPNFIPSTHNACESTTTDIESLFSKSEENLKYHLSNMKSLILYLSKVNIKVTYVLDPKTNNSLVVAFDSLQVPNSKALEDIITSIGLSLDSLGATISQPGSHHLQDLDTPKPQLDHYLNSPSSSIHSDSLTCNDSYSTSTDTSSWADTVTSEYFDEMLESSFYSDYSSLVSSKEFDKKFNTFKNESDDINHFINSLDFLPSPNFNQYKQSSLVLF
ncbi:hypothetical protein AYI70_g6059 [Smittium culicis]|uniref:Uncharacterized protein n=1 Tax=Smittium culicis TaxID=133412 RepID=A0A1R1XRZ4_9FUNG|nr:hypothetical protein AYI70_g6059 [Smittium culicis]